MTCNSPFVIRAGTFIDTSFNFNMSGGFSVPGYTTPGTSGCWTTWNAAYSECTATQCGPGCVCNKWSWCSCCSQDCDQWQWVPGSTTIDTCWSKPGIELWPSLSGTASCTIPLIIGLAAGEQITATTPTAPYNTSYITINGFDLNMAFASTSFSMNIPVSATVAETNGSFYTIVPLPIFIDPPAAPVTSISTTITEDGFTFSISLSFNMLLCLAPVPPSGWVNLQIPITYTFVVPGFPSASLSITVLAPIVSVEEGD